MQEIVITDLKNHINVTFNHPSIRFENARWPEIMPGSMNWTLT
jgi:hypothetical protein